MIKNILKVFAVILAVLGLSSCAKEEIGGTAVQDMAGEWYVKVDGVDSNGNVVAEDPFGMGYFPLYTYNTNDNSPSHMYVNDDQNFWPFCVIVDVNYEAGTFQVVGAEDSFKGISVDVADGAIVKDGTVSQSGYTADSISFKVKFEDDDYVGVYYDALWIHGYRRTGLNGGYD